MRHSIEVMLLVCSAALFILWGCGSADDALEKSIRDKLVMSLSEKDSKEKVIAFIESEGWGYTYNTSKNRIRLNVRKPEDTGDIVSTVYIELTDDGYFERVFIYTTLKAPL